MSFQVWALGSNGSGQLGLGHTDDVSVPRKCCFSNGRTTTFDRPCGFAAGGNHSLILCEDGTLYTTGENLDGRCGHEPPNSSLFFSKVCFEDESHRTIEKFKLCAATWEASTFVTKDNRVYTCGTGTKGELGQGYNITVSQRPQLLSNFPPTGHTICQLTSSMGHTVAVLSSGEVYGWGTGRKGQLGAPSVDAWEPKKVIDLPFTASAATCGREFTFVVGASDEGNSVVIGSDKWGAKSSAKTSVKGWKSIGANWSGIHVLLTTGQVVSWGRNNHGQLCPDTAQLFRQIAPGSEHVLASTADGKIVAWGWGEHGNCGRQVGRNGDTKSPWNYITVPATMVLLGAGCATSWLVDRACGELNETPES